MVRKPCPDRYEEHSDACYFFGGHASFEAAKSHCKSVGARLADVDPINNKYIKDQLTKHGGNDNWIGSYIVRNKVTRRKGTNCPMMKGQNSGSGNFAQVNCNSAYPYICQKYGNTQYLNKGVSGINRFNLPGGEKELPVTAANEAEETTVTAGKSSDSAVIASVVAVGVFIIIAIILRYICNRRRRKARLEKIKELQKTESTAMPKTRSLYPSSSFNGLSRTTTVNKPFSLPGTGLNTDASTITRRPSTQDFYRKRKEHREEMSRGRHTRRSTRSMEDKEDYYRQRSHRSQSRERHLHGRHSPPPPYGQLYRGSSMRSRSRRRSLSRLESMTEAATTRYSASSRSSSSDSRISDTSISRMTETTYRHSHRERNGRHSHRHGSKHYRRGSPRSHYYDDRDEGGYRSGDGQRKREHSRHQPRSMFEEYAHARPPSPALDIMARLNNGAEFKDRRSLTLCGDGRYDPSLTHCHLPVSSPSSMYFPQMTTAWREEDFRYTENLDNFPPPAQRKDFQQHQARLPHHGPIRVNRHIHDIEGGNTDSRQQSQPQDSDHIYESLDEVEKPRNGETMAIPLQLRRTPQAHQDSSFIRDMNRASGRSRASIQSRGLPAIPLS